MLQPGALTYNRLSFVGWQLTLVHSAAQPIRIFSKIGLILYCIIMTSSYFHDVIDYGIDIQ